MKDDRYLSADIDPSADVRMQRVKAQALALIRCELTTDPNLYDDAESAILADYDGMDAKSFLNQLCTFSLILNHLEKKEAYQPMVSLLASLLRIGICKVSNDALEAVTIFQNGLKIKVGSHVTLVGTMNSELLAIVSQIKEIQMIEQRLAMVEKLINQPTEENLKPVSHACQLPVKEIERILFLTRNGFGEQRNFIRSVFEMSLGELACHGSRAFEFSWCVLKGIEGRSNRIAFLNALQYLISRMQSSRAALRLILADFCRLPNRVMLSDRNTMMMANVLLRTYNKEFDVEVEMTPEEVLNVRNGLDKDLVNCTQFWIDALEARFAAKVRTIHEKLIALLEYPPQSKAEFTIRHLLLLEREVFIFLSLSAGRTAHKILISALNEYGDPDAGIYRYPRAASYLPVFLQQLKIIARGVGRIGTTDDVKLMHKISQHGLKITQLYGSRENQVALTRTMRGIDTAMRSIYLSHGQSTVIKDAFP
jgi:hypothetical protein